MLVTLLGMITFPLLVAPSINILLTITSEFSMRLFLSYFVPLKAHPPILVTLAGIVMFVRLVQFSNAQPPMLVTLSGIVMLLRLTQPLNVDSPILVTLSGSVMLSRLVQPQNAIFPMLVTLFGIVIFVSRP